MARREFRGKNLVQGIIDLPIIIPHTAAGVALLMVFGRRGSGGRAARLGGLLLHRKLRRHRRGYALRQPAPAGRHGPGDLRPRRPAPRERRPHAGRESLVGLQAGDPAARVARDRGRLGADVGAGDQRVRRRRDPRLQPQGDLGAHIRALRAASVSTSRCRSPLCCSFLRW